VQRSFKGDIQFPQL